MSDGEGSLIARYQAARRDPRLAVLEGFHALKHALRFGASLVDVRTRDPAALRALTADLAPDLTPAIEEAIADPERTVETETFDGLAPTPHPTGVIALALRPPPELAELLAAADQAPIVLLERPTHHGNIGAVVRVAAAAGAAGVLVTGPHDPWHPSSLRGGAGLQFALPVAQLGPEDLRKVLASDRPIAALHPEGEPLERAEGRLPPGVVLVFGSERSGVSPALLDRADLRLRIPMRAGVSSLNLATAVAVALYATGSARPSFS